MLAILIVGMLFLVVQANQRGRQLKAEHDRLAAMYGELPVVDEKQYFIMFSSAEGLDHGDSNRLFHWRIYHPDLPFGIAHRMQTGRTAYSSNGNSGSASEILASARFRVLDGKPEIYCKFRDSFTSVGRFPKEIRAFVVKYWKQFDIEILGQGNAAVVPASEVVPLLRIRIPESLFDELPANLSKKKKQQYRSTPIAELLIADSKVLDP